MSDEPTNEPMHASTALLRDLSRVIMPRGPREYDRVLWTIDRHLRWVEKRERERMMHAIDEEAVELRRENHRLRGVLQEIVNAADSFDDPEHGAIQRILARSLDDRIQEVRDGRALAQEGE